MDQIVRINPWELHIRDPEFFGKIYTMTRKLDRYPWYYDFIGILQSAFATPDSQLHRLRRGAKAKFFSASAALPMQPHIESCVAKMIAKSRSLAPGEAIKISHAYWCMANDVVTGRMIPKASGLTDDIDSAPQFGKDVPSTRWSRTAEPPSHLAIQDRSRYPSGHHPEDLTYSRFLLSGHGRCKPFPPSLPPSTASTPKTKTATKTKLSNRISNPKSR